MLISSRSGCARSVIVPELCAETMQFLFAFPRSEHSVLLDISYAVFARVGSLTFSVYDNKVKIPTLNFAKNAKFRMGHPAGVIDSKEINHHQLTTDNWEPETELFLSFHKKVSSFTVSSQVRPIFPLRQNSSCLKVLSEHA